MNYVEQQIAQDKINAERKPTMRALSWRRDGKVKVSYTFHLSGRTINKIITHEAYQDNIQSGEYDVN